MYFVKNRAKIRFFKLLICFFSQPFERFVVVNSIVICIILWYFKGLFWVHLLCVLCLFCVWFVLFFCDLSPSCKVWRWFAFHVHPLCSRFSFPTRCATIISPLRGFGWLCLSESGFSGFWDFLDFAGWFVGGLWMVS